MKLKFYLLLYVVLTLSVRLYAQNIEFIENQGQWDGPFKYKAMTPKGDIFLEANCFTYVLEDTANRAKIDGFHHGQSETTVLNFHAYKVVFEGCSTPLIIGSRPEDTYCNYYLGNNQSRWKSNIHPDYDVDYKHLYKGIDMHIFSDKGNMEYEFDVAPNADATQIAMSYNGAKSVRLRDKDLYIATSVGDVVEMKPYAYQYVNEQKVEVRCKYKLRDNIVTLDLPDGYDHSKLLVIDPTIVFCTFTGSTADNWGFTATYDAAGDFYAGGIAHDIGYPVSTGAFQTTYHGGSPTTGSPYAEDMAIIKFNPTGSNRIYATYIGGSDNEQPHSLIVDANNDLIIAGKTYSVDFPVTTGAYDVSQNGGADIVVIKLNAAGTALIGSTYVGGSGDDVVNYNSNELVFGNLKHNYGDDARSEVQLDRAGNIYVAASTKSTNFPTVNAIQTTRSGNQDGVVIKLNSTLTTLLWSTYIGGSSDDAAYVIAFDTSQASIYIAGGTQSSNFPTTTGAYQTTYQGAPADGWITKFQNGGTYPIQKSTYIGTSAYDQVYGLQVDATNNVYAMGQTLGSFPVSTGVYSNPGSSQFIIRLDSNLATNQLSTVYGSGTTSATNISPVAFLVDTCGNIYISGWGGNLGLGQPFVGGNPPPSAGTTNMPITPNAAQSTTDGNDFYFICLSKNMVNLIYGTYFGRNETDQLKGEHVDGGTSRFDKNGIVYQGICGGCAGNGSLAMSTFPTTQGAWSTTDNSNNCNEAALKIAFNFGPVSAAANPNPTSGQGCAPLTVQFANTSTNGATYAWNFEDGSPVVTTLNPSHTFTTAGVYHVQLAVNNVNACTKTSDTAYITITVDTGGVIPLFSIIKLDSCGPYIAQFTNSSLDGTAATVYNWAYGDGATYTGVNPPNHTYSASGSYTATLTMTDATLCTTTGTISHTLTFAPNVTAVAATIAGTSGCAPFTVAFQNSSINGNSYVWNFGDGSPTVTSFSPTHTYTIAGTYTVKLASTNTTTCNKADSTTLTITVKNSAVTPIFTITKIDSCSPYIISISNTSQQGTTSTVYTWNYGDGTTYTGTNPPNHTYAAAGTYTVTLTMTDITLCTTTATITKTIVFYLQVAAALAPLPGNKGCAPFAVQFQNQSSNANTTTWDFGDGSALSTATSPAHTYNTAGVYHVRLISGNINSCKKADTAYTTITVSTTKIAPFFSAVKPDSCDPYIVIFTDSSAGTATTTYRWLFGDGGTFSGATPPAHTYAAAGTYTILLIASDTAACNPLDTFKKTVSFNGLKVKAGFATDDTICLHTTAVFNNTAANGAGYSYTFNGQTITSSGGSATYLFTDTGSYTITQVVVNNAACNGSDTFTQSIYVTAGPVANFTVTPDVPVLNMPVTFTNESIMATRYLWDFGDQATSTAVSPTHMYNRSGQYNACLTAYNAQSCPSKLCKTASADIEPIANLPTAFSPNGDGANDILYVRGAAIQSLDLLIFNRWGQLVFETTSQDKGWDGTFNGKPQEMDAYAYVLKVLYIDGTSFEKKGNVTLLR